MPATDAASLLSSPSVAGYNNFSAQAGLLKLALLQVIANALAPSVKTDAASLLASANVACYNCNFSWPLLELALLQVIAQNIGSGGGGSIQTVVGFPQNPNTGAIVPANPAIGAIYYQDPIAGTGTDVWLWGVVQQRWSQLSV